jgi:hypothetical protein
MPAVWDTLLHAEILTVAKEATATADRAVARWTKARVAVERARKLVARIETGKARMGLAMAQAHLAAARHELAMARPALAGAEGMRDWAWAQMAPTPVPEYRRSDAPAAASLPPAPYAAEIQARTVTEAVKMLARGELTRPHRSTPVRRLLTPDEAIAEAWVRVVRQPANIFRLNPPLSQPS